MGQAKERGTFEERKAAAVAAGRVKRRSTGPFPWFGKRVLSPRKVRVGPLRRIDSRYRRVCLAFDAVAAVVIVVFVLAMAA